MPKTRRQPSPHSTQKTRRRGAPNPLWAKMLAGLRHHGNRLALLTTAERRAAIDRA